jgi:hypothetical protein
MALGKKFVMHQTFCIIESDQHFLDLQPFLQWDYQSYIFNQLTTVSLNACCSILYGHFSKFSAEFNAKTFQFSTFILLCDEGIKTFAL